MRKVFYIVCAAVLSLMSACIDEDDDNCRTDYTVEIAVADKNYANISQYPQYPFEQEDQPFGHFQNTIYYALTDKYTGKTVSQSLVTAVTGNDRTYKLVFHNLPLGEYNLTAWGNMTDGTLAGILHPQSTEHTDIYIGTIDFCNCNSSSASIALQRTKGKLLIFCKNFPSYVTRMHQSVKGIYSQVDSLLNYQGSATIEKDSRPQEINALAVSPSITEKSTRLNLSFYSEGKSSALLTVPEIELNIRRNELSAVSVDFDKDTDAWNIWVYSDKEWTLVHHLTIE